ncbi:hypothetical protein CMV_024056 [Castanea mollissima]|uniref:Uncharacterized protein n=1 Tax=Castanea mollissima TaxID=60419 RepID=A0A8J4QEY1_9ROSI|nr:hypothetical protein CMV_024056 [Castanea mollissima]
MFEYLNSKGGLSVAKDVELLNSIGHHHDYTKECLGSFLRPKLQICYGKDSLNLLMELLSLVLKFAPFPTLFPPYRQPLEEHELPYLRYMVLIHVGRSVFIAG